MKGVWRGGGVAIHDSQTKKTPGGEPGVINMAGLGAYFSSSILREAL